MRETGDSYIEGRVLLSLGNVYQLLGDLEQQAHKNFECRPMPWR